MSGRELVVLISSASSLLSDILLSELLRPAVNCIVSCDTEG